MNEGYMEGNDTLEWTPFQSPATGDHAEEMASLGLKCVQDGKFEDAANIFERVVQASPNNAHYRVSLASAYQDLLASGRVRDPIQFENLTERACEHLLDAVRIDPDFAPAYRSLGFLYKGMEAHRRAREMWSFYLEMEPEGPFTGEVTAALEELDRVQNLHGLCEEASYMVNHGEAERGLGLLREVTEEEPDWYDAWFWTGLACRELQMLDRGIEAFARAAGLDPESPFAYHELGALLARKGEWEAAEGFWRKALELADDDPWIMANLALLLWRQDRRVEADALFARAHEVDPANRKLWMQLCRLRAGEAAPPEDL